MRRHWSARLVCMLGAVWFVLVGAEPAAFGACPAHVAVDGAASHGRRTHMPTDASMHQATGVEHDAGAPENNESHQCTCPGECCGPSAVVVPSEQPTFTASGLVAESPSFTQHAYRAQWTDHVLPFGTAPPQSHLA